LPLGAKILGSLRRQQEESGAGIVLFSLLYYLVNKFMGVSSFEYVRQQFFQILKRKKGAVNK